MVLFLRCPNSGGRLDGEEVTITGTENKREEPDDFSIIRLFPFKKRVQDLS